MRVISLYIHVPYCTRRCSYCSFYHLPRDPKGERAFVDALGEEIRAAVDALGGVRLRTVFVGGGTPSALAPESLERVFDAFAPYLDSAVTREVTCELNPEDVTDELLEFLRGRDVDRVSVGIQSMDPALQRVLKRCSPETNAAALEKVMSRFDNVSCDVLLGIPGGSTGRVKTTLVSLLAHAPRHFSVYCLEPGGDMEKEVAAFFDGVDPERSADEYLAVCALLRSRGYRHYEVSNFALPGFESAHNRVYWDGDDFLGVGPGAHSFIDGRRFSNAASLSDYLSRRGPDRAAARVGDDAADEELERAMLALRTSRGMPLARIRGGDPLVAELCAEGLARVEGDRLVLTDRGFLVMNDIVLRVTSPC